MDRKMKLLKSAKDRFISFKKCKTKVSFTLSFSLLIFFNAVYADTFLKSPDSNLKAEFNTRNNKLHFKMYLNEAAVINNSPVGIIVDGQNLTENILIKRTEYSNISQTYPIRSVHSKAKNHCNTVKIHLINQKLNMPGFFEARAYNDGLAFRLVFENSQKREVSAYGGTFFDLPDNSLLWYHTNTEEYEGCYNRIVLSDIAHETFMAPPVTVELPDKNGFLAITEAALINFTGMSLMAQKNGNNTVLREYFKSGGNFRLTTDITTPWRVIMTGQDLNTLVNCDIIYNCCPEPDEKLSSASWIKPGRCVWSWLGGGGVTYKNMKLYAQLAGQLGFEYNLIDEGWGHWDKEHTGKKKWDLIKELVDYSKKYNVNTWVWKACKDRKGIKGIYNKNERLDFFQKCRQAGVSGVKIDFMNSESKKMVNFYNQTLQDAADYNLMVNFHGSNKPTGLNRTYPNEMTREGIYGLERGLRAWARHNTILPFTRFLAGHADYTPLSFSERKGETTWSHQLATLIVFTSPLMVYAEHPRNILDNPACNFIKNMPTVWDETIVLPFSEIGKKAAFARRKNKCWYIGILNGYEKNEVKLKLNFLDQKQYSLTQFKDVSEQSNAYSQDKTKTDRNETLIIKLNKGGGYAAVLSPL